MDANFRVLWTLQLSEIDWKRGCRGNREDRKHFPSGLCIWDELG